ncbi:helix-turn-helix transcriptional regulator [Pseudomonas citronellolis]|uniref:helix-turn-helix transcriptional regulator n=1 Tax=Pseudomonas citronellolis TaxID=53408 RepID=UPI0023E45DA3|nr:LuxR C-terminal-related transcriptional regulator [Pseudomonas citronellolis]MDF3933240.1 LuxR C-terminal-related transcriptional regulator [Pseudomonas citronellolis]
MPTGLPPLPPEHLHRPRLRDPLLQGAARLRLLCAPGGYGKSQLLRECAHARPDETALCWLDLRGAAADAQALSLRLAAGLGLADSSVNAVAAHLARREQPLWIMLDHLPALPGPGFIEALGQWLDCAAPCVGWWLACRRRPALPLTRLLLDGELLEVNAQALALTPAELGQWLAEPQAGAAQLHRYSHGWFAGASLQRLAAQRGEGAASAEQLLSNYLHGELLAELDATQRETLCLLACLPSFDACLYEALFELHTPAPALAELLDAGVFIEPTEQGWRVGPAVAALLADSLPKRRRAWFYRSACQHYAGAGDIRRAIHYALLAEQPETAASLAQRLDLESLLGGDGGEALLLGRTQIPEELLRSTAELVLLRAWALFLGGQLEPARTCLAQLAAFLPQPDAALQAALLARWQVLDGHLRHSLGEPPAEGLREALACLPAGCWAERVLGLALLSEQALAEGAREQARRLAAEATQVARERGSLVLEALLVLQHSAQLERRGELLRAEAQLRRVLAELAPSRRPLRAWARLHLAHNLWRQGRLEEARDDYAEALPHCAGAALAWAHAGLAELDAAAGQTQAAFDRLGDAERAMQRQGVDEVLYRPLLDQLRGRLWLGQGHYRRCLELAEAQLVMARGVPGWRLALAGLAVRPAFELLRARAALALGQDCSQALEGWLKQAQLAGLHGQAWELGFALAEAHLVGSRQRKAQAALFDALAQARRSGDQGSACYWHSFRPEVARWVGRAGDAAEAAACADSGQLSRREHSVLNMIAEGLANQEIAERLHISLHTVKSHAQRINTKLGVSRRTQAIVRAKALGLVR